MIPQTVLLENAKDPDSSGYIPEFEGSGYISLSIIYASSVVFDLVCPSILTLIGIRASLILAGSMYAIFVAAFYAISEAMLYSASVLNGFGTALIWIAHV